VVREAWEFVYEDEDHGSFYVLFGSTLGVRGGDYASSNRESVWKYAYAFTVQRQREIARYQTAQTWLNEFVLEGDDAEAVPVLRELVTAKLAKLQRGMKGAR
jgi:hypothetical protein